MRKVLITELAFRDAHQSLLATRMGVDDLLVIAEQIDQIGFHSIESWGGATFDACIRYLNEDPFKRLALLKEAMPKTPQQMLIRGQNLLGYRHYADDLVDKFVERAVHHGMDIFRIFDALNDPRNLKQTINAVIKQGSHAQGTLCYTTSPFHNSQYWLNLALELESMGCHSLCIKDMSGILTPYTSYKLVKALKENIHIPIFLHSHATSGLSSMSQLKAIEAGIDGIDTAISPLSMTYSHSATESMISAIEDSSDCTTNIDLERLLPIASYFREVRKKYHRFEGELKGVDARIIHAQVPGGMLTNMESQLNEQKLSDRFDEVIAEIPKVRKDLGYIPLVTPTSQIVGTQAVINVTLNERYKNISKEVQGIIKGEYGQAPSAFNQELVKRVLKGDKPITCRPADLLENEMNQTIKKVESFLADKKIDIKGQIDLIDAALIYALFPQIGLNFLEEKYGSKASGESQLQKNNNKEDQNQQKEKSNIPNEKQSSEISTYQVRVNGEDFQVQVIEGNDKIQSITHITDTEDLNLPTKTTQSPPTLAGEKVLAPMTGNVLRVLSKVGKQINASEVIVVLEAMKMEVEVKVETSGIIKSIHILPGDSVKTGQIIAEIE